MTRHIFILAQLSILNVAVSTASEHLSSTLEISVAQEARSAELAESARTRVNTDSFYVMTTNCGSEAVYVWTNESISGAFTLSFDVELSDGTLLRIDRILADELVSRFPMPRLIFPGPSYAIPVRLNRLNREWTTLSQLDRAKVVKLRAHYRQDKPTPRETVGNRFIGNHLFWNGDVVSPWVDAEFSE